VRQPALSSEISGCRLLAWGYTMRIGALKCYLYVIVIPRLAQAHHVIFQERDLLYGNTGRISAAKCACCEGRRYFGTEGFPKMSCESVEHRE
jgi:hypothetical protein